MESMMMKQGQRFVVVENRLIREEDCSEKMLEDLEFARRSEEALDRCERGEGIKMTEKQFERWLKKW